MRHILVPVLAALLVSMAFAQEGRLSANMSVEVQAEDGSWAAAPSQDFPFADIGQTVRFTITVTNLDSAPVPAGAIVFTGQVYDGMRYLAHDLPVKAGQTDAEPLYARVEYRHVSGGLLSRRPPADQVDGVQWRLLEALAPNDAVDFRYQVVVVPRPLISGR